MGEKIFACRSTVTSVGRKLLGRPRSRSEEDNKIIIREMGCEHWWWM
jgi:hypothetical protein